MMHHTLANNTRPTDKGAPVTTQKLREKPAVHHYTKTIKQIYSPHAILLCYDPRHSKVGVQTKDLEPLSAQRIKTGQTVVATTSEAPERKKTKSGLLHPSALSPAPPPLPFRLRGAISISSPAPPPPPPPSSSPSLSPPTNGLLS